MRIVLVAAAGLSAAAACLGQMQPSIGRGARLELSAKQAVELALRAVGR